MSIKTFLQKCRLAIGKMILDHKIAPQTGIIEPKKLLFLRKDGKIGDYIVSSFVFREIKKQDSSIQIDLVCTPKNHYLFEGNPDIDNLFILPSRSLKDHFLLGKVLAKQQYDVVIDPTVLLRNRDLLLLRMVHAKHYIGYKKSTYQLFDQNIETSGHFSEIYCKALNLCGIKNVDKRYELPFNANSTENVAQFLAQYQLKNYIAINFFGAANSRKFSKEKMQKLLQAFKEKLPNKPLLLLTYPEVTPLLKKLSDNKQVFLFEETESIFDTIALIEQADWVISPDTAIIHIASGLNKNIVGFYKNDVENWQHWHPTTSANCHIINFNENINEIIPEQIDFSWFE